MKRKKNIFPIIKTILISVLIITLGYDLIAKAGFFLASSDSEIQTVANIRNDSYVFFSQSQEKFNLYPWNLSADAEPLSTSPTETEIEIIYYQYFDKDVLYNNLNYYFRRFLTSNFISLTERYEISFYELIDFENIEKYLTYSSTNDIFFYTEDVTIQNDIYTLSFTFNSDSYVTSFLCINTAYYTDYSEDVMNNGNRTLTDIIEKSPFFIEMILSDICSLNGDFDSYSVMNYYLYSGDEKEYEVILDNNSKSTYQIIKLHNEFLLLVHDYNIVLHFDPLSKSFIGFNLSNSWQ